MEKPAAGKTVLHTDAVTLVANALGNGTGLYRHTHFIGVGVAPTRFDGAAQQIGRHPFH